MELDPDLPLVSADLPGIGGAIKGSPADFVVEEIPAYEPCGVGEHLYLRVRREGLATRDVQRALAAAFGVPERDIGCAGQKDKIARATQSFSLPVREGDPGSLGRRAAEATGLEVLHASRHGNKLGRGHLLGNRFEILVAGPGSSDLPRARAIAEALFQSGVPNFFGEQRLGAGGRNVRRGERRLAAPRRAPSSFVARMELSAWQSSLFNAWLAERIRRGWFERVLQGDLARKSDTGGLFEVLDPAVDEPRCRRGEISATGPIFGARMRWPTGEPAVLERSILDQSFASTGADASSLERERLPGSRRAARVFVREFSCEAAEGGLRLAFTLEKGAFATVVLREFTRGPD
jgi:tRNA pseudouridine13 synthase